MTLGANGWQMFWRVTLPLAWPGILTGLVLAFTHSVGEFGVVLMVGGNIPGVTRTLSISIYDNVQAMLKQHLSDSDCVEELAQEMADDRGQI